MLQPTPLPADPSVRIFWPNLKLENNLPLVSVFWWFLWLSARFFLVSSYLFFYNENTNHCEVVHDSLKCQNISTCQLLQTHGKQGTINRLHILEYSFCLEQKHSYLWSELKYLHWHLPAGSALRWQKTHPQAYKSGTMTPPAVHPSPAHPALSRSSPWLEYPPLSPPSHHVTAQHQNQQTAHRPQRSPRYPHGQTSGLLCCSPGVQAQHHLAGQDDEKERARNPLVLCWLWGLCRHQVVAAAQAQQSQVSSPDGKMGRDGAGSDDGTRTLHGTHRFMPITCPLSPTAIVHQIPPQKASTTVLPFWWLQVHVWPLCACCGLSFPCGHLSVGDASVESHSFDDGLEAVRSKAGF